MRSTSMALYLLLAGSSLVGPTALAQTSDADRANDTRRAVGLQQNVCSAVCTRRREICGGKPGFDSPTCDTGYVTCQSACRSCLGGFGECLNTAEAIPRSCQAPFVACLKQTLAQGPTDRPLIRFAGGDGLSRETAIVVLGARNEFEGIAAESLWAAKTHPSWRKRDQALLAAGGKSFDLIGYDGPGSTKIWFEVTAFFEKM